MAPNYTSGLYPPPGDSDDHRLTLSVAFDAQPIAHPFQLAAVAARPSAFSASPTFARDPNRKFFNFLSFDQSSVNFSGSAKPEGDVVVGQEKEPTLDLRYVRVGQQITIPYDITVGLATQWQVRGSGTGTHE